MALIQNGAVVGTGGGKFGAPSRWQQPRNTKPGAVAFVSHVMVAGVGDAVRGRRTSASIDLVVGEVGGEWQWMAQAVGMRVAPKRGAANSPEGAEFAVVAAAKELAAELAARPRESASHPPIGPAVWPCA